MLEDSKRLPLVLALGAVVAATGVFTVLSRSGAGHAAAPGRADGAAVAMVSREQAQLQQARILAAAGRSAIWHVAAARWALTNNQPAQARRHLEASGDMLAYMGKIRESSANDSLDNGGQEGHLVPLYARLGSEKGASLSEAQKRDLIGLATLVARGEHEAVAEQLRSTGLPMAYGYIEMPLDETEAQVAGALEALDDGATDRALAFLSAVEDGLLSQVIDLGVPAENNSASPAAPVRETTAAQTKPAQG